jgi:hypothetical protein
LCLGHGRVLLVFTFLWSKLNLATIEYYTGCDFFGLLQDYCICEFYICFIVFIVLWGIVQAAFFQLVLCKKLGCDGVETQSVPQVS